MSLVPYFDADLEQALCDIANREPGWEVKAPSVCAKAMSRICDLENAWSQVRDKFREISHDVNGPDNSAWRS